MSLARGDASHKVRFDLLMAVFVSDGLRSLASRETRPVGLLRRDKRTLGGSTYGVPTGSRESIRTAFQLSHRTSEPPWRSERRAVLRTIGGRWR
jgi:hypothetical protein